MSDDAKDFLWDDDAFRRRVRLVASAQGRSVNEVLVATGLSPWYLVKRVESRSTNLIMRLARELKVTPTELAGWPAPRRYSTGPGMDRTKSDSIKACAATDQNGYGDRDKHRKASIDPEPIV